METEEKDGQISLLKKDLHTAGKGVPVSSRPIVKEMHVSGPENKPATFGIADCHSANSYRPQFL